MEGITPTHGFKLQLDLLRITTKARLRASDLDLRCRMFLGALAVSPELTRGARRTDGGARVLFLGGDVDAARALAVLCLGVDGARAAFPNWTSIVESSRRWRRDAAWNRRHVRRPQSLTTSQMRRPRRGLVRPGACTAGASPCG